MSTVICPCPHCDQQHDITSRLRGDVVWCRSCGGWFRVVTRPHGRVYLAKAEPPPGTQDAQPPTADAELLAEMSALRAELETVKGREVAARGVVEAARLTAAGPDTTNYMRLVDALDAYDQATKE